MNNKISKTLSKLSLAELRILSKEFNVPYTPNKKQLINNFLSIQKGGALTANQSVWLDNVQEYLELINEVGAANTDHLLIYIDKIKRNEGDIQELPQGLIEVYGLVADNIIRTIGRYSNVDQDKALRIVQVINRLTPQQRRNPANMRPILLALSTIRKPVARRLVF